MWEAAPSAWRAAEREAMSSSDGFGSVRSWETLTSFAADSTRALAIAAVRTLSSSDRFGSERSWNTCTSFADDATGALAIAALRTLSRVAGSRGTAINGGVTSLANSSSQSQCLNAGRLPSQGKRQSMDSTIAKPAVNSRFHNSAFSIGHSCSCGHSIFSMILRIASRSPRLSLMLLTRVLSKGVREPPKLLSASSWSCWATKTSLATAAEKKWRPLAVRRR